MKKVPLATPLKLKNVFIVFLMAVKWEVSSLKNNNSISFSLDTSTFYETLNFKGNGADKSNFIIINNLLQEKQLNEDLLNATKMSF
tara:strand:- start:544 stop:801 length:258 start_codon:yes stop_codon:yes gene_type:complete